MNTDTLSSNQEASLKHSDEIISYHCLDAALHLGYAAAALIRSERAQGGVQRQFKATRDIVTETDVRVEKFLSHELLKRFPDSRILGEETAPETATYDGMLWVLDPIDGTTNYARGHQDVAVSIACVLDRRTIAAVVLNPFSDELYYARRNAGSYYNYSPLSLAAECPAMQEALIGIGRPFKGSSIAAYFQRVQHVFSHAHGIRRQGAGALDICRVAGGRLDAFFETLNPWDVAAALLIAREAGCAISRTEGHLPDSLPEEIDGRHLLVSHPALQETMLTLLSRESLASSSDSSA